MRDVDAENQISNGPDFFQPSSPFTKNMAKLVESGYGVDASCSASILEVNAPIHLHPPLSMIGPEIFVFFFAIYFM